VIDSYEGNASRIALFPYHQLIAIIAHQDRLIFRPLKTPLQPAWRASLQELNVYQCFIICNENPAKCLTPGPDCAMLYGGDWLRRAAQLKSSNRDVRGAWPTSCHTSTLCSATLDLQPTIDPNCNRGPKALTLFNSRSYAH